MRAATQTLEDDEINGKLGESERRRRNERESRKEKSKSTGARDTHTHTQSKSIACKRKTGRKTLNNCIYAY